jgi:hypothetical protein
MHSLAPPPPGHFDTNTFISQATWIKQACDRASETTTHWDDTMNSANTQQTPCLTRRQWLWGMGSLCLIPRTEAAWWGITNQPQENQKMHATEVMKWEVTFCSYGVDIDPQGQSDLTTLWTDNWFKDADSHQVASFFTGFGAAWGAGSSGMGGPDKNGSRLPKTFRLTYYDYLEDKFYRLDGELPQKRIHELFKKKIIDKDVRYGTSRGRFDDLRFGVAPRGNVMLWAAGFGNQVELQTYQAAELKGMTRKSYNASLPGGTFTLMEDRWKTLEGGGLKPTTLEKIKNGWVPDPNWYMRHIRVKFPWRHRLTGNVAQLIEMESYQGNAEAESVGAWEMSVYNLLNVMRGIPETAKFWFIDRSGQHHHIWLSFSLRERAVSESDLSEIRAAFDQIFPNRQLEDNDYLPSDADMATVEVHVSDDFKTLTASLVKDEVRLPLPVGRTQHFALNPWAHWPKQPTPEPAIRQLFQYGPPQN